MSERVCVTDKLCTLMVKVGLVVSINLHYSVNELQRVTSSSPAMLPNTDKKQSVVNYHSTFLQFTFQ